MDLLLSHYVGEEYVNQPDFLGITPLHAASEAGNLPGIQRLIECGANVNAMDNGGSTPIEAAGDHIFQLTTAGVQKGLSIPDSSIAFSTVELYIYLGVYFYLRSQGGLPGSECIAKGMPKREIGPVRSLMHTVQRRHC